MSADTSSTSIDGADYYHQNSGAADAIVQGAGDLLRFTVHPGDVWFLDPNTVNRSEIASGTLVANRTPVHVAYAMSIQSGAVDPNPSSWAVLGQFHQNDGANVPRNSPPFSIQVVAGKMQIVIGYTDPVSKDTSRVVWTDPKPIVQGATYAMDIKATFDPNGNGHLAVRRNGVTLVDYSGPLGYASQNSVYWKEGIYRGASTTTMVASYAHLGVVTGARSNSVRALASTTSVGGFRLLSTTTDYDAGTGGATGGILRYISTDGRQALDKRFNGSGTLVSQQQVSLDGSTTTTTYGSNGAPQQSLAVHADGSSDNAQYGLKNQPYVGLLTHKNGQDVVTWQQENFANGSKSVAEYGAAAQNYKTKTTLFSASGAKVRATYAYRDGSSAVYSYASGGAVTHAMLTAKDGTQTATTYAGGVTQRSTIVHPDGSKDYTNYDASGHKTSTYHGYMNGSSETDVFAGNGATIQKIVIAADGTKATTSYRGNGTIQSSKVVHADGSRTYTAYDATGHKTSAYYSHTDGSSETDVFASNGSVTQKFITAKNGTRTTDSYGRDGSLDEMRMINTDGSRLYMDYDVGKHRSIMTKVNAAGTTTAVQQVEPDGSATGKALAAGVTLTSQGGNDTFTSFHNDTFVFHQGFGHDTIKGFNGAGRSHDVLQIDKSLVADFSHVHMTQIGANALITVSPHDDITLKGVNVSALSASSFSFV